MAPEFNFIIQPEDNPLVENVKNRAAANRQALSERQQNAALEQNIRTKAETNKAVTQKGTIRPKRAQPDDELTAYKKPRLKVLNLFMGNGPVHVDDRGDVVTYNLRNRGTTNAYFEPGPENNQTYDNITTIYNRSLRLVSSELNAVTENKTTNVFLHIVGSQYMSAQVTTPSVELPEGTFTYYSWQSGPTTITDALPTDLTDISNIQKITMQANVTDVVGHLRTNGVDINSYDCIFIQTGYRVAEPALFVGEYRNFYQYPFTYLYTIKAPRIHYNYSFRSLLYPVIFDGDGIFEENEDPDSAPLANLLTQLNTTNTYVFEDEFSADALAYLPNATVLDYTTDNVTTVMQNVKKRRNRLVSCSVLTYPVSLRGVSQAELLIGIENPGDEYPNPRNLIFNRGFGTDIPFFATLALRLKYPIVFTEVSTPDQTYLTGNSTVEGYVIKPVETTERTQPLYQNLLEAYSTYLYNVCIANPPLTDVAPGFTSSTSYTYALDPNFDTDYLGPYYDRYYSPYLEYTVTNAMRRLYSAAIKPKDLRR